MKTNPSTKAEAIVVANATTTTPMASAIIKLKGGKEKYNVGSGQRSVYLYSLNIITTATGTVMMLHIPVL